ncbi:MAG: Capsule biosynthesis protein CapB [Calditrichaeota bacterium]|nr:Capsule biosynthesis protein CapB [Calditrichota bacterium]
MLVIVLLATVLIAYGTIEYLSHRRRVYSIPIRVHVNGTRGKSSVTRLIAAGLRAGGIRTMAKVTGTKPRIINHHGLEIPIIRLHPVNIIEQIKVFRFFSKYRPEAVVVECMAVQPDYQWVCEHRFVRSTVGVMTNVRLDHTLEMGQTIRKIANSLANTVPTRAPLFTAETSPAVLEELWKRARAIGSEVHAADPGEIDPDTLREFSYIEHPSNVALALAVCEHLGVSREAALAGMLQAFPDPGALRVFKAVRDGCEILFLNAMAANDAQSTYMTWERARQLYPEPGRRIVLLNTRADRFDRSVQLVEMMARHMQFDLLISMGESTDMLTLHLRRVGIPAEKVRKIGQKKAEAVFEILFAEAGSKGFVFACGNAGHGGLEVAELFRVRSREGVA